MTLSEYISRLVFGLLFVVLLQACESFEAQKARLPDTPDRGTIRVSADESFKPVIDEQVKVYEALHPETKILVEYKPEAECLRDMLNDSVRMLIVTRRATADERELVSDSLRKAARSMVIARDGISVILHPDSPDTLLTMDDIRAILKGNFKKNLIPVFDGVKATSTVRFVIDSVLKGDSLTPQAMAARSSEGVIDYVSKNPGVIGFIGVSWIGNKEDTTFLSFNTKVKVAYLRATDIPDLWVKAYQANIYIRRYPMVRDLVYILKENHRGLGTGFANFMSGESGQLVFKRAYLAPSFKNLSIRPVKLNE